MAKIAVIIPFQTSYNDLMMKHGEVYIQKKRQYILLFFVCFYYTNKLTLFTTLTIIINETTISKYPNSKGSYTCSA